MKLQGAVIVVAALATVASAMEPRLADRRLDAVADAAFITCQPYIDACDSDPACPSCDAPVGNNKLIIEQSKTCDYNLGVIQKVRRQCEHRSCPAHAFGLLHLTPRLFQL